MGARSAALRLFTVVALVAAGSAWAQDPVPNLNGYVTLSSGYWKHGLAQNDGTALQLGIDYEHHTGFFTYARATNVDFAVEYYGETRDVEASAYVGYHRQRGRWSWTASLGRYLYPGTEGYYDYNELSVNVGLHDRVFYTASYNDDYYGGSNSALNQEVSAVFPLRGDIELGGAVGHFQVANGGVDIDHWNLGVSKLVGRTAIDLRYYDGSYYSRPFLGDPDANHYVLSVSYALRGKRPRS